MIDVNDEFKITMDVAVIAKILKTGIISKKDNKTTIAISLFLVLLCFELGCYYAPKKLEAGYDSATGLKPPQYAKPAEAAASEKPELSEDRKLHYNGYAKLRVTEMDEILNRVADLAAASGGYTEKRTSVLVTVRVPVSRFHSVFKEMLALGAVLQKSITVNDITEEYTDIELRLSLAKEMQKRLTDLLAKAETEEEKLELLREIRRVTEEIEYLTTLVEMLKSLAEYSRLTVEVEQRHAMGTNTGADDIAEFRWIHSLSPFRRDVWASGKKLEFEVPKEMVALDKKGRWIAESADGTIFWACKLENKPRGDTDFWFEALKYRLAPEFESSELDRAGKFRILRLADRAKDSYIYLVGVRVEGDRLELVEVCYPSVAREKRYGKAILESISRGEK